MKNTNFCKVYGGGIAKIAATMGCSLEEATEFVRVYEEKLPFVKKTLEAATRAALRNGEVRTILGRKQRFVLWEPRGNWSREHEPLPREAALERYGEDVVRAYAYAALNRVLQGSAADLLKKAMVDAWEAGVGAKLGAYLVTVHDELGVSVAHRPAAREALAELKRHMEVAIPLRVPVIAELELGKTWGDCK